MLPDPAAEETLAHLQQFKSVLWLDNPCTTRRGRCVYLASDARALFPVATDAALASHLEAEYCVETRALPSFISAQEFRAIAHACELCASDSYICHGSASQGSGRSVIKGRHQLKGVGRTLHAGFHGFHRDVNGALALRDACVEAFHEKRLRRILGTRPLPIDFILIPEHATDALQVERGNRVDTDIRCVMGRRGSPLRLGHLEYMAAECRAVKESNVGSYLVHLLLSHFGGVPAHDIHVALLNAFDVLLQRAVRLTAESQVYSLRFSYWPDNFDLFSRVVDVGETAYRFPELLHDASPLRPPRPGQSPHAYLSDADITHAHEKSFSLYPIRNVLSAMHLVWRSIDMDESQLDERFSWEWLRRAHAREVIGAIAKVIGVSTDSVTEAAAHREVTSLAGLFPLLGESTVADAGHFCWEQLADVENGAGFRARITRSECDGNLAELDTYVQSHIIQPYLASGCNAVARDWRSIPHLDD